MRPGPHCRPRIRGVAFAAGLLLTAGCATSRPGSPDTALDLAWPAGEPKIRIHSLTLLEGLRSRPRTQLLRRLAGDRRGVGISRPFGVAWDGEDLLVTDAGTGRVLRVTSRGRLDASPARSFESPMGIAVCGSRVLVVDSSAGLLIALRQDLHPAEVLLEGLERPTAVACAGERIWVVETAGHRLLSIDPEGRTEAFGARGDAVGEFNFPTALAAHGDSLWIADTLNFRIQRLDRDSGAAQEVFGNLGAAPGELPRVKGIAVDSSGNLWVSDAHLDQVALFSLDGDYLMSVGGLGTGPGQFSFPAGIAAHPDGRVAVVDSLNRRIQIFELIDSPIG